MKRDDSEELSCCCSASHLISSHLISTHHNMSFHPSIRAINALDHSIQYNITKQILSNASQLHKLLRPNLNTNSYVDKLSSILNSSQSAHLAVFLNQQEDNSQINNFDNIAGKRKNIFTDNISHPLILKLGRF
jgi:hypothetical protein